MKDLNIDNIRQYILKNKIKWTEHCSLRMFERGIHKKDIKDAIMSGDIIEYYPTDYPYPSCLVLGYNENDEPVHIVCGIGNDNLYIITVYCPDIKKWIDESIRRKN